MELPGGERRQPLNGSQDFGREEARWFYRMSVSKGEDLDSRSIEEAALEAVESAVRVLNRPRIDIIDAAEALKEVIIRETGISETE